MLGILDLDPEPSLEKNMAASRSLEAHCKLRYKIPADSVLAALIQRANRADYDSQE